MFEKIDSLDSVPVREVSQMRRRVAVRYRCHLATPARVAAGETEHPRLAWVYNLSTSGIGLLLEEPVEAAIVLEIDLITPAGQRIMTRGRVAHASRRADGNWLVGCQFEQPIDPDQLELLL